MTIIIALVAALMSEVHADIVHRNACRRVLAIVETWAAGITRHA